MNLTRLVQGGGWLMISAFSDVVDDHDRFRPGGFTTRLRGLLGLSVVDFGALRTIGRIAGSHPLGRWARLLHRNHP